MIEALPHQVAKSEELWQILKTKGYAYLAGKPRSGKTLTAILTAEKSTKISSVLVLTKKNAIPGWLMFTKGRNHKYHVTNYEQVGSIDGARFNLKLNPNDYQLVIIDESHNLGAIPKPSGRIKLIRKLCWELPHIHLSGTAIVESPCSIFPQMTISKYNPFPYKNFYDFHRVYGQPYFVKVHGKDMTQYDRAKPELLAKINEFTAYMTQEDAGIDKSLQAEDKLHYVELLPETKKLYNYLQEHQVLKLEQGLLIADTTMKLRVSLHMLESGIAKIGDDYFELGNTEKIDYIKNTFGDSDTLGIMCHFIGERILLEKHFRKAKIYSSNAHSEGVDLSHLSSFVILSSDYSGAKFIQRRERIVNINGSNTLHVHHILVKKAISEQVYKRVSKKQDFNNETYDRSKLS